MTAARFGVLTMAAVALLAAGCGKKTSDPSPTAPTKPPGLYAEPTQLAFTCVNLGCDESKVVRLTVVGDRRVAVKRLLLTGPAAADFSFTASTNAPFIMGSGASFDVTIRYAPRGAPSPGSVVLAATYTDASPDESEDRLPPGELPIPLVRRLVGEPELIVNPTALHYGVVLTGSEKTLELRLANGGFGNVALDVSSVDAGSTGIVVALPAVRTMVADSGIVVPMTWRPTTAEYLHAQLEIAVSTPGASSGTVLVDGTSLSVARVAVAPTSSLDFGEVPKGQSRRLPIEVVNQGGAPLIVSRVELVDSLQAIRVIGADGGVLAVDGGASFTVAALAREPLVLELTGATPGELEGQLLLTSNDPSSAVTTVELRGTVTEPKIQLTPMAALDFGTVPQGWVVTKPIELRNVGFGSLTVKNISFVAGSSTLYSLVNQPVLPVQLRRDQRIALEVQFRAETAASFNASVSVETDDANHSFAELPVTARVGTCDEGCPIANGLPNCTAGVCSVESCNVNWYDTDGAAANGCECHDLDTDPGAFCAAAADLGTLRDKDKVQRSFTGLLAAPDDIDVMRFFAEDNSGFFDEDFNVKIRLESNDPSIKLCIYRHDNENHSGECYFDNEECPQNRSYERDGTLGREDGADFILKISRLDGVGPVCTTYTVFVSNGL